MPEKIIVRIRIDVLLLVGQTVALVFMLLTAVDAQSKFDSAFLAQHQQLLTGQAQQDEKIEQQKEKLDEFIKTFRDSHIESRLVRLETSNETNYRLLLSILGCVGLIALKAIVDLGFRLILAKAKLQQPTES